MAAMSLMTDAIERIGAALAFGTMLLNLAWGVGETIGAPAAASLSRATSDAVPLLLLAGTVLVTLVPVLLLRLGGYAPRAATAPAGGASSDGSALAPASAASNRRNSGGA
jgi:hypothetical protein